MRFISPWRSRAVIVAFIVLFLEAAWSLDNATRSPRIDTYWGRAPSDRYSALRVGVLILSHGFTLVKSSTQFGSQLLPPSAENDCSPWNDLSVTSESTK